MKSWSQHYWTNFVVKHEDKIFWLALSNNCNITEDVVVKHKHKPWDHATLCGKIITPHCALNTLKWHDPWYLYWLSQNPHLTMDFIKSHLSIVWDWFTLSGHRAIDFEFVLQYRNLPWNWTRISGNATESMVLKHFECPWDWLALARNFKITPEFVVTYAPAVLREYPLRRTKDPWVFWALSQNRNVSSYVLNHPDNLWDWSALSWHISLSCIQKLSDKPWDWDALSSNPNTTEEFILDNLNKPWNWCELSRTAKPEFMLTNPTLSWDWSELSRNIDIVGVSPPVSHMLDRTEVSSPPDISWDWKKLSKNPSLTFRFLEQNNDRPWNWLWLSANPFLGEKRDWAARRIQNWWMEIRLNPYHPVGRKLINQSYDRLYIRD